jgi:hypothetical protein
MTRLFLLALIGTGLAVAPVRAAEPASGETRHLDFIVTWKTTGESAINRVYRGTCKMMIGYSAFSLDDKNATKGAAPSEKTAAKVEDFGARAQKCGTDVQCLSQLAQEMQKGGTMDRIAKEGKAAVAPTQQKNFGIWNALECTNMTLTADDTETRNVSDSGEGGDVSYRVTTTTKGSGPVENCLGGACVLMQHDLNRTSTEYRFAQPISKSAYLKTTTGLPMNDAPRNITIRAFPDGPHPSMDGSPRSGKIERAVPGGTLTFDWTIRR